MISIVMLSTFYSSLAWTQLKLVSSEQKQYAIENKKINESSGLACSTRDKKILWTHNDSGHMPIIYAMNTRGENLAVFHIEDIVSYDWEDMDAFEYQGSHFLLIADTGDNRGMRWDYKIHIIKEPVLNKTNYSAITASWTLTYVYEDGRSYDVESVAVDILRNKIILLTKRTSHAIIFELPLKPSVSNSSGIAEIQTAVKVGEFKEIVNPSALDISSDGKRMSINTYKRIHRFHRGLSKEGQYGHWLYYNSLKYKNLFQPEAMCLSNDEKKYYVTSERKASLLKINNQ